MSEINIPYNKTDNIQLPGRLDGETYINLQTDQAVGLLRGRPKDEKRGPIIGLIGFASQLGPIWTAALENDPYAEWWLYNIEQKIEKCSSELLQFQEELTDKLDNLTGLEIEIAKSTSPTRIEIHFTVPLAFLAAQMLTGYDRLSRIYITAKHVGVTDKSISKKYWAAGSRVRGAFTSGIGYHSTGITWDDLLNNTPLAKKACAKMGEIPDYFLSGEKNCSLLPPHVRPGQEKNPKTEYEYPQRKERLTTKTIVPT